ncbi:DUF2642 domain-containing protein [Peribacillus sp. V2I11]|uniref:DUF2642 domain-containing protein n=1 Tax=Peribacillus sp. V2I11 TaxID=3042277 RepID=UPI0027869B4D|nr:DUF2642 domain-containing protein [Peribacillus sp. V2I11]MDQ0882156.1 chemotaxis protein histidine kinase CheA [Peribacillus sp. V2I11]
MKKQNFQEALNSLIGFNISIISDDKTVHNGVVLDVKSDFIVIQMNPNKQCYFNLNQVYALSKNTKEFQVQIHDHEPTQKQSFTELINELKGHWVTVNRDNNLSFDGFLSTVTNNYIVLLKKDKQLYVQLSNIHYIFKGIDNKESSENKQQENKDEKTENKQSDADQVKESDSELKEETEVNSKGKEEPVEQKQEQDILTIGKEEPASPTEISAHPEVLSDVKEEPTVQSTVNEVDKNQSNVKEERASAHPEVLSNVKEEPTVRSSVNEVNKDQSNVKRSTDKKYKKYKKQKSSEKKKKESKKEKPSETNKKDIQVAIQENLTEEFRNSGPQEMNEQSAKKNDLKEKRKLIDKKCYELMKSTEKMYTENGNQKNEYYSLMKFAERMQGKLKAKRLKP